MQNDKLKAYLALASAAAAGGLNAQVQYTDFEPDLFLQGHKQFLKVDIDGDGTDDFVFVAEDTLVTAVNGGYAVARLRAGGYYNINNRVLGDAPNNYGYASQLEFGDPIGPDANFVNAGSMALVVDGTSPFNEPWNGGAFDGFLGFYFTKNDTARHYGWMRIDVSADGKSLRVKDAAYSTIPDTAISAGLNQLQTDENILQDLVHLKGNQLQLNAYKDWAGAEVYLFDLSGKLIFKEVFLGEAVVWLLPEALGHGLLQIRQKNGRALSTRVWIP